MTGIQEGMTAAQVSETIMGNFSEVSAEIDSTKTMVAKEELRAKGVEEGLTEAVAQNAGEIIALKENSATKVELEAEADRAQSAEELINQQAGLNFRNFSELGVEESAKKDGYEIALTKRSNTAEKTKVKVPVYDMQNPSATPVGLVDEIFVEDMKAEAKEMVDAEAERAQAAEQALGTEITDAENRMDERLTNERDKLQNAMSVTREDLVIEVTRATTAEEALSNAVEQEAGRATDAETSLANQLGEEEARAKAAEGTIMEKALANAERIETLETASATKAELSAEAERAQAAEKVNADAIAEEVERAGAKEQEIEGKVTALESSINRHIVIDNVAAYSPFLIGGYIKAGTLIRNNGVNIIISKTSSLDGRVDLLSGQQYLVSEDMRHFQTSKVEGEVNIDLYLFAPYDQPIRKTYYRSSVNAYSNVPISISKGTVIVNHGVGLIIASDSNLADRFDLNTGNTLYADTDKTVVRALADGDVSIEFISLAEKSIHGQHIADKAISPTNVKFIRPLNIVGDIEIGKYYNGSTVGTNPLYDMTGFIQVEENQQYCWNTDARFVVLLDSNKKVLRVLEEQESNVTTESGEVFMRVTFRASEDKLYQIERGNKLSAYTPTSQEFIDKKLIPPSEEKHICFKSFRQVAELNENESVVLPKVNVTKNTTMTALLNGEIGNVSIGVGLNDYYGRNITINSTDVVVKGGSDNNVTETISHGLVINDFAIIEITKGNEPEATIRITNDAGENFETIIPWGTVVGQPFLKNESNSVLNVTFNFFPKDINQSIWMFGDSYFGMYDTVRWLYYVIQQWKHNNFLVNAKGGENASEALSDLKNLLSLNAVPKYLVWCMGMNNANDNSDGSINSTWMTIINNVIDICDRLGIELVLSTIPSVPGRLHVGLNEWVKNSGYRYIDFAAAVESGNDYYWKGWGTEDALLSNDEVHPSKKGAAVLAAQAIVDFPEITIVDK